MSREFYKGKFLERVELLRMNTYPGRLGLPGDVAILMDEVGTALGVILESAENAGLPFLSPNPNSSLHVIMKAVESGQITWEEIGYTREQIQEMVNKIRY